MEILITNVSSIKELLKDLDATTLSKQFDELGIALNEIRSLMTSSFSAECYSDSIKAKTRAIESKCKGVLRSVLDEIEQLRSFRNLAVNCLQQLMDRWEFINMKINVFMKKNDLSSSECERIFKKNGIAYADELLEAFGFIDELELVLKPNCLKRLESELSKAEKVKNYLERQMEKELEQTDARCKKSLFSLTSELQELRRDLEIVEEKFKTAIDDAKKGAENRKFGFNCLKYSGLALATVSWFGSSDIGMKGGLMAAEVGHTGVRNAIEDLNRIETLGNSIEGQTLRCRKYTEQTTTTWRILIKQFIGLLDMLKKNGVDMREQEIRDIKSHIKDTKKGLDKFDKDIEEVEKRIRVSYN